MGSKRKITIQDNAIKKIAATAFYIESELSEISAKKFVDDIFIFLEQIANPNVSYHSCTFKPWQELGYRCISFRKKYVVAYLEYDDEIIITDFSHSSLLK